MAKKLNKKNLKKVNGGTTASAEGRITITGRIDPKRDPRNKYKLLEGKLADYAYSKTVATKGEEFAFDVIVDVK